MPVDRTRTPAQTYRRFGEVDAGTSPLYQRVAIALSESGEALRAIGAAPARKRQPSLILAALHDLALAGRAPALAEAYAAADDAAAAAAIDTLLRMTDSVVAIAVRRRTQTFEPGRCAVLYPAIAEAARRVGADAVGLIDVGGSAGLNLQVDRIGITYDNGRSWATRRLPCSCRRRSWETGPSARAIPEVVTRVGVDLDPVDVTDADDARWMRACVWPDQPDQVARLDAALALTASAPPTSGETPSRYCPTPSPAYLRTPCLSSRRRGRCRASRSRAVCASCTASTKRRPTGRWPGCRWRESGSAIPTLGDRRASGHSIIGLAMFDRPALRAEAIGRCWSRGRVLAWLTNS